MVDARQRWCLFCDLEVHSSARGSPRVRLTDYVDDLLHRTSRGEAYRLHDHENRITRIADATLIDLPSGSTGLALVVTQGDQRGAAPSFLHWQRGHAREAERQEGEVPGVSAHCVIELDEDPDHLGRHRMLIEESRGLGRTPVTQVLHKVVREISRDRDERFESPDTGNDVMLKPALEIWPQKSRQMEEALERGTFGMVELYDTRQPATWDEAPEFRVERRTLKVRVQPANGDLRGALGRLRQRGRDQDYAMMKVNWRMPGGDRGTSDIRTDLEDLGTALLARRELIEVEHPMAGCTHTLNDEFVGEIARLLV